MQAEGPGVLGTIIAAERPTDLHAGRAEGGAQGRAESPAADYGNSRA